MSRDPDGLSEELNDEEHPHDQVERGFDPPPDYVPEENSPPTSATVRLSQGTSRLVPAYKDQVRNVTRGPFAVQRKPHLVQQASTSTPVAEFVSLPIVAEGQVLNTSWNRYKFIAGAIVGALVVVAGLCGSGHCRRKPDSTSAASSIAITPMPTQPPYTSPTGAPGETTLTPTETATRRPTEPPTRPQTALLTTLPTKLPTTSPTTPASTTSRGESVTAYINTITLSGSSLVYPSSASPEERALKWLIDEDPLKLRADTASEQFRLRQRYALTSLFFQSNSSWWISTAWLDADECTWHGIGCTLKMLEDSAGLQSVVTKIYLGSEDGGNNLQGWIPPDLALLASLEEVSS